jgi:hypothetical protein
MYLRTTQRRNKDGSVVRYYALAENVRHPGKGYVEARPEFAVCGHIWAAEAANGL